ncbi:DUF1294 domain-containing protein [Erythrobacter sp.]|jgi:uncharacterized membrane protein YsdA (DUF1294 family)|uniref:DUF1294 domain-containing protein n=1 Tax=Erythrobacter sp. TaxID=1042 RepID=UPI002EB2EC79|nr:DUF1294 domain-containing protein [Erythrobacter sp.]
MDLTALLTPANIPAAVVAVNVLAFAAFGINKAPAGQGMRRISEDTLLQLAFFGGVAGPMPGGSCSGTKRESSRSATSFT